MTDKGSSQRSEIVLKICILCYYFEWPAKRLQCMTKISNKINKLVEKITRHEENWTAVLDFRDISDPSAVDALSQYVNHPHWLVRWCVADTLGNITEPRVPGLLTTLIFDTDQHVRKNAIKAMARQPDLCLPYVFARVKDCLPGERVTYLDIITRMRSKAIGFLSDALKQPDWMLSNKAAELLWKIGGSQAVACLCTGLEYPNVRKTCVVALGTLKDPSALPFLTPLCQNTGLKTICHWAISQINKK